MLRFKKISHIKAAPGDLSVKKIKDQEELELYNFTAPLFDFI